MKSLADMSLQELWELFPIVLVPHDESWEAWYAEERSHLRALLPDGTRISHVGSTAIPGIWAKPIIDILAELPDECSMADARACMEQAGYLCMSEGLANGRERISLNKGYTEQGFAERVFHVHMRRAGDADEVLFRDYLREHADVASDYEALKLRLWKEHKHDRDAYTEAKTAFVRKWTEVAKQQRQA